jgi:hypothetical protein
MTWIAMHMKTFPKSKLLCVNSIGEAARELLMPGSRGEILAAFSKAVYLKGSQGELVWLATEDVPMHRRSVQIRGPLPKLDLHSNYIVREHTLRFDCGTEIDLEGVNIWTPELPRVDSLPHLRELHDFLTDMTLSLGDLPSPKGFGYLLPEISKIARGQPLPSAILSGSPALNFAWPEIREIFSIDSSIDHAQLLISAERLIGLGSGLTPSGDDFIGGMLFIGEILHKLYQHHQGFRHQDLQLFLAYAREHTNLISYTVLKDHARGHGSEVLHQFVNAVLDGEPQERIHHFALKLTEVGHSTGWDILAGVWTGMLLWVGDKAILSV